MRTGNGQESAGNDGKAGFFAIALGALLLALCELAHAQQTTNTRRIGYLSSASRAAFASRTKAFLQGLQALGWVEGENIVIESKYADGKFDRLPTLAAELVQLKVDLILTSGATTTRGAKKTTAGIPIVMAQDPDPVGNGFVASLAHPGGNITGLSALTADLSRKRLELLKEIEPTLSSIAIFETSTNTGNKRQVNESELAAQAFGLKPLFLDINLPSDIESAFRSARKARVGAVLVLTSEVTDAHQRKIAELAAKSRLPVMYAREEAVEAGGLVSYGVSIADLCRRAASYVDKILRGRKPADLPVEQPTKFEFVVNLKAAKRIGLTIPPNVLARADRVIR